MYIDKTPKKKLTPKSRVLEEMDPKIFESRENHMVTRAKSSVKKSLIKDEIKQKTDISMISDLPLKNLVNEHFNDDNV